ncbi:MAG: hypothetical protein E3J72_19370 [Planctomycetota bacterium]|nr:MAG: hypothetical protein E3J72_19370 [Planctomycetota bacterium]
MEDSFSIDFKDNGLMQIRISGKFNGHSARKGLAFLKTAVEQGIRQIRFDLSDTVSFDSLGIGVFDWIRSQNGDLNIEVIPPVRVFGEDELESISLLMASQTTVTHYS